jgi:hypothetical protein
MQAMRPVLPLLLALLLLPLAGAAPDEKHGEPPMLLSLEHAGNSIPVRIGQPFEIEVDGKRVSLKLTQLPYRVLEVGPVSFRYPSHFTYEYDSGDVPTFTVEGPDTVIMLTRAGEADEKEFLDAFVSGVRASFGNRRIRATAVELAFPGRKLKGHRLDISIGPVTIRQKLFAFRAGGETFGLMIQDSLDDDGKPTETTAEAVKLMLESIETR